MEYTLGPLVRLDGISTSKLPPGGHVAGEDGSKDPLSGGSLVMDFITSVINEAAPFIDGVAPKSSSAPTWKTKGSPKRYASSESEVVLSERVVLGKELDQVKGMNEFSADKKNETWFCRRSCHRNAAEDRTASWSEFVHAFKENHPKTEDAFTPTVIGASIAITWDLKGVQVEAAGEKWDTITMAVVEMTHRIDPKPLKNRTFPVLQLSANLGGVEEFLVVSIPLTDFDRSPHAKYAHDKGLVMAAYVSIERIRILPSNGEIEWIMATASDAKGVLPQWMQNMAVPGQVAHDVDLFLKWIPSQRSNNSKPIFTRSSTYDKSLPAAPVPSDSASMGTVPPPPISKTNEAPPAIARVDSSNKALPTAPKS